MKKANFKFDTKAMQEKLKNFDWRSLQKYTKPQAADDLNTFLEKLPQNTGQNMLVMAGVAWAFAAVIGLFTVVQMQKMTELKVELEEAQAVKPIVPQIINQAVNSADVKQFAERIRKVYTGLDIRASGSTMAVSTRTTNSFGEFREAIGHLQSGGAGWRVSVEKLCVGRECPKKALSAVLKIGTVTVKKPG